MIQHTDSVTDETASDDADSDNNLEEILTGSFPGKSDGTAFVVTQFPIPSHGNGSRNSEPGTIRLAWNSTESLAPGESYIVEVSPSLEAGSWETVDNAAIQVINWTGIAELSFDPGRLRKCSRLALSAMLRLQIPAHVRVGHDPDARRDPRI